MTAPVPEPVRFRPRRIRVVAWVAAVMTLLATVGLATALSGPVGAGQAVAGPLDRAGMVGLGMIGAAALLTLTRPLVEADAEGVRVRNVVGDHRLPWHLVRAVRFERGASWATLELPDDEVLGVLAVQAVDREYAVAAVRALRVRHEAYRRHHPEPGNGGDATGGADPDARGQKPPAGDGQPGPP